MGEEEGEGLGQTRLLASNSGPFRQRLSVNSTAYPRLCVYHLYAYIFSIYKQYSLIRSDEGFSNAAHHEILHNQQNIMYQVFLKSKIKT